MKVETVLLQWPGGELQVESDYVFLQQQSTFAKGTALPGAARVISIQKDRVELLNLSIAEMYLVALSRFRDRYLPYNRLMIDELPPAMQELVLPPMTSLAVWDESFQKTWRLKHGFIYALRISTVHEATLFRIMMEDLNRFFGFMYGLRGRIVTRAMYCLCLTHDRKTLIPSGHEKSQFKVGSDGITLRNKGINQLVSYLNTKYTFSPGVPVVDKSHWPGPVNMSLATDGSDLEELNKELANYGCRLSKQLARIEMLLLTKIKANNKDIVQHRHNHQTSTNH
ncbi:hypothetical protein HB364_13690 [Pseudoflavitalea sp. X16]|uniref:hypothetical protein n=1 Tax=Paraflavitalea devenefica TaxID=2716334 RepID=UPI001423CA55|nr:hypothetical protein [Paraflavitalea devenefica]NII26140.1 hypothetical protein [Paraflavitalea devenefica]